MSSRTIAVLYETRGHHVAFSARARVWLDGLAEAAGWTIVYVHDTESLTALLETCALLIQLDYPPYGWTDAAVSAFERYIAEGRGGWIGLHHAALLGEFDGFPMWNWFSRFLGGIRYENYIASLASGVVHVETPGHPCMKGVSATFTADDEEWYTWTCSPRPHVHVLARVDEATYRPDSLIKMGDHPVVWTNPDVAARNVYIFMGHSPRLFDNPAYTTLFRNAIVWGAGMD